MGRCGGTELGSCALRGGPAGCGGAAAAVPLISAAAASSLPVALLVIHPPAIWVKIKLVIKVFKKPLTILIKLCVFQMTPGLP